MLETWQGIEKISEGRRKRSKVGRRKSFTLSLFSPSPPSFLDSSHSVLNASQPTTTTSTNPRRTKHTASSSSSFRRPPSSFFLLLSFLYFALGHACRWRKRRKSKENGGEIHQHEMKMKGKYWTCSYIIVQ